MTLFATAILPGALTFVSGVAVGCLLMACRPDGGYRLRKRRP